MDSTAAMAPFERIAESIRGDIRSGARRPGEKLPTHRDLASEHNVALATAQKAVQLLQDTGWATARPSVGVFVNEPPLESGRVTLEALSREVADLRAALEDLAQRVQQIEGTSPAG